MHVENPPDALIDSLHQILAQRGNPSEWALWVTSKRASFDEQASQDFQGSPDRTCML